MDVSNEKSIKAAGIFIRSRLPEGRGLWAIINNAGILFGIGPTQFRSKKHYQDSLAVNLYGVVDVTREFLPLVQMERGRVVNTSSVGGRLGVPGLAPYSISKYGVEAFSDCLRREMYYFGVSVHIIEPGSFRTGITDPERYQEGIQGVYDQAPSAAKRLYGDDYVEQVVRRNRRVRNSTSSSRTDLVVDAYVHATTSMAPSLRYTVGWIAKCLMFMLNFPTIIMDLCLVKTYIKPSRLGKNNEENSNIAPSPEKQS